MLPYTWELDRGVIILKKIPFIQKFFKHILLDVFIYMAIPRTQNGGESYNQCYHHSLFL